MLENEEVFISKILAKILVDLGKSSAGKKYLFVKHGDKVITSKKDEGSLSMYIQLVFDRYSLYYPEKILAFKNISEFFKLCDLQGLGKDDSFIMNRCDEGGFDGIKIENNKSELFYRLSNPDSASFDGEYGFGKFEGCEDSDPTVIKFNLSKDEIENIVKITSETEAVRFNFTKRGKNLYIDFNGPIKYKLKIEKYILDDNFIVDSEIKFKHEIFEYMKKTDSDYICEYISDGKHHNFRATSKILVENENIDILLESPSRIGE